LTVSVPDGSAIQWRYKSSDTSGSWTGLSYVTASDMNSTTVDCPYTDFSFAQSVGSCSAGSATVTVTLSNSASANTTVYVKIRYQLDGSGALSSSNLTVSSGDSNYNIAVACQ
jgi:hypothetical protein